MRQLSVYHDPFSRATQQPKIPDGKVTESLGFQTQAVGELSSNQDIVHILMYGGFDAGMIVRGETQANNFFTDPVNRSLIVGYTASNGLNWQGVSTSGGDALFLDKYSQWRLVSQGLKLSLLNPVEQDDGWWESVRVTEPLNSIDWNLHSKNASGDINGQGTCCPQGLIRGLEGLNVVNERSYATGLLRDLGKHTFTLHPQKDDHDFRQQSEVLKLAAGDVVFVSATDSVATFDDGSGNVQKLVEQTVDTSHDFIYIRIHGRTDPAARSRLHYNLISNQEIQFGAEERESRFQTRSSDIGGAMNSHMNAKKGSNVSADRVMS